jgi:hypothetical protein
MRNLLALGFALLILAPVIYVNDVGQWLASVGVPWGVAFFLAMMILMLPGTVIAAKVMPKF